MGFMEKGTTMVAAIAVCAILILSVLVPVIADNNGTVERRTTLENEGTPIIMGDVAEDYTVQWDSALPGMVKINGSVTTVYFVAGPDATVSPDHKDVTVDLTYGELPVPTRTGYTFDGWFTSTEYTTEITEDTVVVGVQDKTLYAKWTANTYTVTFDAMGGTVNPATKTVTFDQAYGELPEPSYTGHIFGGWFDENNDPISSASIVSIASNHTLHAVYTTEQYLISFTTDGNGTVDVQNVTVDYGTAYTISGNTVVIDGTTVTATPDGVYVFDHWTPSTSGTITGATVFIANFVEPPVTLTFAAQSPGSVDTQTVADVPRGTQYTVLDNTVVLNTDPAVTVTASLPDGYYMIGWNIAQGTGTVTDAMTFTASYELIEIADVVCTNNTTWIITEDGKLFGCGANGNGNQGDGTTTNVLTFTQRLSTETIASVSCSDSTTWAVTTDGKLFGCGQGMYGQQGDGTTTNVLTFTQRLSTETIASVSCSQYTTWAVTTDGKLFGCGQGMYGQQGAGSSNDPVKTFTQRLNTETIANVSCSNETTWVVTTDGKLFGCGNNTYGKQGNGSTIQVMSFTQRLTTETITKVVCSTNTTWAVTTDGKLFGCGRNNNGQQGDGTTTDVKTFTQRLDTETIASVSCSQYTTWAVTTDGKLFGCGTSIYGQQGNGTTTNVTTFTQCSPAGSVNIPVVIQPLNVPNLNPHLNLLSPAMHPLSINASAMVGTEYTWHMGGNDWMLCTVSTGQDQYALALFYAGATSPLLWENDVTLVFSNGTLSGENDGTPFTMTYTSIFYKGGGDYLLMSGDAYVMDDTNILGYAIPSVGNGLMVKGTISALTAENIGGTIVVGDAAATTTGTDYADVSSLSELSASYDTDQTAVCSTVIVPKTVTATETVENVVMANILSIIPIVLIVGLMLAVVGTVLYKRM